MHIVGLGLGIGKSNIYSINIYTQHYDLWVKDLGGCTVEKE